MNTNQQTRYLQRIIKEGLKYYDPVSHFIHSEKLYWWCAWVGQKAPEVVLVARYMWVCVYVEYSTLVTYSTTYTSGCKNYGGEL